MSAGNQLQHERQRQPGLTRLAGIPPLLPQCAMEGCTRCEQVGDRQICHGCDHERGYAAVERRGWREFTSYVCAYAGAPAPAPGPALQPLDSELANI